MQNPEESYTIIHHVDQEHVKGAMHDVRVGFIIKVYCIVTTMLVVTFGLASPFVFHAAYMQKWIAQHWYIVVLCMVFLIAQHLFHLAMSLQMCCSPNPTLLKAYLTMFRTVPWNYCYLYTYAIVMGVVVGVITFAYSAVSVCFCFALSAVLVIALTIYAATTKSDFTGCGPYIFVAMFGFMLMMLLCLFLPIGSIMHRIIGGIGATLFGFIIVYDTQLIFGSASSEKRELEYTIDMYAYAAFELYLDFVNFFLYMLQAFGDRD